MHMGIFYYCGWELWLHTQSSSGCPSYIIFTLVIFELLKWSTSCIDLHYPSAQSNLTHHARNGLRAILSMEIYLETLPVKNLVIKMVASHSCPQLYLYSLNI
jgi:hypothetical protein